MSQAVNRGQAIEPSASWFTGCCSWGFWSCCEDAQKSIWTKASRREA